MKIVNAKSKVAEKKPAKKKATPKKRKNVPVPKKKSFTKLDEFPEDVQKKVRATARTMKNKEPWKLRRYQSDCLPSMPRRKEDIQVKSQALQDVGGYDSNGGLIFTLVKKLQTFAEVASAKGATDLRVRHRHFAMTAWRKETDAEFQKRVDKINYERAKLLAIKEAIVEKDKEEEKRKTLEDRKDQGAALRNLIEKMGVTQIQKALDRHKSKTKVK